MEREAYVNQVRSVPVPWGVGCAHGSRLHRGRAAPAPSVSPALGAGRTLGGGAGPLGASSLVHCRLPHRLLETRRPSLGTVRLA